MSTVAELLGKGRYFKDKQNNNAIHLTLFNDLKKGTGYSLFKPYTTSEKTSSGNWDFYIVKDKDK